MSANRLVGYVLGVVYILVGLLGFVYTGFEGFAEPEGDLLLGIFGVNPLHNVVHMLVGLGLVGGAAAGTGSARMVNLAVGAVYLALGVAGFPLPADSAANILALNVADHVLHLGSGVVLLGVGLFESRARAARTA